MLANRVLLVVEDGLALETTSVDAGYRQALTTILGEPLRAWDVRGVPTASELKLSLDPTAKNDWTSIAAHTTIAAMATATAPLLEPTT